MMRPSSSCPSSLERGEDRGRGARVELLGGAQQRRLSTMRRREQAARALGQRREPVGRQAQLLDLGERRRQRRPRRAAPRPRGRPAGAPAARSDRRLRRSRRRPGGAGRRADRPRRAVSRAAARSAPAPSSARPSAVCPSGTCAALVQATPTTGERALEQLGRARQRAADDDDLGRVDAVAQRREHLGGDQLRLGALAAGLHQRDRGDGFDHSAGRARTGGARGGAAARASRRLVVLVERRQLGHRLRRAARSSSTTVARAASAGRPGS